MPALIATKNGNAYTASVKISQSEQTDADSVEKKPKGKHGGGSMYKGVMVAPSTTTAAQFWT